MYDMTLIEVLHENYLKLTDRKERGVLKVTEITDKDLEEARKQWCDYYHAGWMFHQQW